MTLKQYIVAGVVEQVIVLGFICLQQVGGLAFLLYLQFGT